MSIVKQALSAAVVPVRHTRLNTIDTPESTDPEHLTDQFFLEFPGYRAASVNSSIFLGVATKSSMDERIWAHELVTHCRSGIPHHNRVPRAEGELIGSMTSNILIAMQSMTRERAERFIAPLFIYSRSHIETQYEAGVNGIPHDKPIIVLETIDPSIHNLKTEVVTGHMLDEISGKFTHRYGYAQFMSFGDQVRTSSSGVLFSDNLKWKTFIAPDCMSPADPYGPNAPSARAVVGELLRELRSQSDVSLAAIILRLLVGLQATAIEDDEVKDGERPYRILGNGDDLFGMIESWKRPEPGIFKFV